MNLEDIVDRIQSLYPQIYYACHVRHARKRANPHRLSERDTSILAHLSESEPWAQAALAEHLAIAKSTLSEALGSLAERGFVAVAAGVDQRRRGVLLTALGRAAVREGSVLDPALLRVAVERLSPAEQKAVVRGLRLLASAPAAAPRRRQVITKKAPAARARRLSR